MSAKNNSCCIFCYFLGCALLSLLCTSALPCRAEVVLENACFRYVIDDDGRNKHFIDKGSGTDYCSHDSVSLCGYVQANGKLVPVSGIVQDGNTITMEFEEAKAQAVLKVIIHNEYIELHVSSVRGESMESLIFLNIPLTLQGMPDESFAACALSLNLKTRVKQLPALQSYLWAACYNEFGLTGAGVALIGTPQNSILPILQTIIKNADELPKTIQGGPWAQNIAFNHSSYMFNFGDITEENVDEWIAMVISIGFNQVDHHGGRNFFRWGDFQLDKEKWPDGWDSMKRIVARLHDAGIGSIFHTYSALIDKTSRYVTPIPHQNLDASRSFTLAESIDADDNEIHVLESTADVSTITGFMVRNSVTLHIDDELITFSGVTREHPYKFTGCERGVHGTRVSPHPQGVKARQLKEIVGLFMPDVDTPLFEEIAKNNADMINYCNFDGIYFDAHGGGLFRGRETGWHYDTKFIYLVWKHLKRPVGMEFGGMEHHWWQFRTRWLALDYPRRGYKRFIDKHIAAVTKGLLLPPFLGWWSFHTWDPPQIEPTYPDVIEYMGCKLLGYNAGLSLHGGIDKESLRVSPAYKKLASILKQYQDLQHSNYFDESVRKRLREPGKEFTLFQDSVGKWNLKPVQYAQHKVEGLNHPSSTWQIVNPFHEQPLAFRLEVLMSAGAFDDIENIVLLDSTAIDEYNDRAAANGITYKFVFSPDKIEERKSFACFEAFSAGKIPQNGSWAKIERKFEPLMNLKNHLALGVWIYGDGKGELLNVRLESPEHLVVGLADHYIPIDFTGWRYFELIETESSRHDDYSWPEDPALYEVYREGVDFGKIESVGLWYHNIPPGKNISCYIGVLKALPMAPNTLKNPAISINGNSFTIPAQMKSGDYLEFTSLNECTLFGSKGERIADIKLSDNIPSVKNGINNLSFSCDGTGTINVRANIMIMSYGEPLK